MPGFHNNSFNPQMLVVLETAFDEAWLTLKSIGNKCENVFLRLLAREFR
jgi:hypothetical protein